MHGFIRFIRSTEAPSHLYQVFFQNPAAVWAGRICDHGEYWLKQAGSIRASAFRTTTSTRLIQAMCLRMKLWVMRTGTPWADVPEKYPSSQTCPRPFQQWIRSGVMKGITEALILSQSPLLEGLRPISSSPATPGGYNSRPCSFCLNAECGSGSGADLVCGDRARRETRWLYGPSPIFGVRQLRKRGWLISLMTMLPRNGSSTNWKTSPE